MVVPDPSVPVASFRQASKRFGEIVAARDLNFDVHGGEFLSFLGPSGCGKTTMLRMIAGFEQPTEGEVYLHDMLELHVVTDEGEALGQIVQIIETGANPVYVVRGARGELLLPDTDEVILDVDLEAQEVTVHLIEGLR